MNIFRKYGILILIISTVLVGLVSCKNDGQAMAIVPEPDNIIFDSAGPFSTTFQSLEKEHLFNVLFDHPVLDSAGNALWRPNFAERLSIPIGFDGWVHTALDTLIYFEGKGGEECAAVIFAHYRMQMSSGKMEIAGSHFEGVPLGMALFKASSTTQWELYGFSKHFANLGYMGTYRTGREDAGKISLKVIGDRWTCLSLKQGIGGSTGVFSGSESLYAIEERQLGTQKEEINFMMEEKGHLFQKILSYPYFYSQALPEPFEQKTTMQLIPRENDYFTIELISSANGKLSSEKYIYSEKEFRFLKQ